MQTEIVLRDAHFFLNNLDITSNFSKKERHILQKFLTNKNKILSREEVASAYWGDAAHEEYSDWAIDQLISRLRKKMNRAGLFQQRFRQPEGRGYLYA
jgi:DNA-binding response OmpR family regulator